MNVLKNCIYKKKNKNILFNFFFNYGRFFGKIYVIKKKNITFFGWLIVKIKIKKHDH